MLLLVYNREYCFNRLTKRSYWNGYNQITLSGKDASYLFFLYISFKDKKKVLLFIHLYSRMIIAGKNHCTLPYFMNRTLKIGYFYNFFKIKTRLNLKSITSNLKTFLALINIKRSHSFISQQMSLNSFNLYIY